MILDSHAYSTSLLDLFTTDGILAIELSCDYSNDLISFVQEFCQGWTPETTGQAKMRVNGRMWTILMLAVLMTLHEAKGQELPIPSVISENLSAGLSQVTSLCLFCVVCPID